MICRKMSLSIKYSLFNLITIKFAIPWLHLDTVKNQIFRLYYMYTLRRMYKMTIKDSGRGKYVVPTLLMLGWRQ